MAKSTLYFSDAFTKDCKAFSLIELPADILKKIEADPTATLRFVGHENQEAVMVTEDKTYSVRRGETSNMQLLFPCTVDGMFEGCEEDISGDSMQDCGESSQRKREARVEAVANVQTHLEIIETAPRLKPLVDLLNRRPYEGPDYEEEECGESERRLTKAELARRLQASPKEIDVELHRLGALEVDGSFCLLGTRYESNLMCTFFAAATIQGWELSCVRADEMQQDKDMSKFPDYVLKTFLRKYEKAPESDGDAAMRPPDGAICLDLHKMALFRADELLGALTASQRLTVDEFMTAWASMLPEMRLDVDMLLGRAITEQRGAATFVKCFDVNGLSLDTKERFKQIFQQKKSWRKDEILPYIADLPGAADSLLLKHTRVSRVPKPGGKPEDEIKMYSSRL